MSRCCEHCFTIEQMSIDVHRILRILAGLEYQMSQASIDAAVAAWTAGQAADQAAAATLQSDATALAAALAPADTSALDALTVSQPAATAALDSGVSAVSALVPPPA